MNIRLYESTLWITELISIFVNLRVLYLKEVINKNDRPKFNYYDFYTIKSGDSLYKIGNMYNLNPKLLAAINGIDMNDYIYPGQTLLIPKENYSYYITKDGDTLKSVADVFNSNVDKLLDMNKTIYLSEGQMIVYKKN